ncbi:MAG TPA: class I SAM-dependent methyltransferase [Acidimicrobiales bacterium]
MAAISFDRAADFYDASRSLPDDVHHLLTTVLATELGRRSLCLEIGVGTGRIALPLAAAGVRLVGVDIAPKMLQRLVANAGGRQPFPISVADVTALPFDAVAFDAVIASHLLHLIPEWGRAVDEAVRVLRPGGAFLVDFGGGAPSPWNESMRAVLREHGVDRARPGMSDPGPVADHLSGRARARPLPPLTMTVRRSLGQDLADTRAQINSWTWSASAEQIAAACDALRQWAADNGWPLDRQVELHRTIQWWAFDIAESP